jgi:hypothetical protein
MCSCRPLRLQLTACSVAFSSSTPHQRHHLHFRRQQRYAPQGVRRRPWALLLSDYTQIPFVPGPAPIAFDGSSRNAGQPLLRRPLSRPLNHHWAGSQKAACVGTLTPAPTSGSPPVPQRRRRRGLRTWSRAGFPASQVAGVRLGVVCMARCDP